MPYLLVLTNYINPQKQPFLYVKNNTLTTLTKCLSCFFLIRYFASSAYWKALDSSRSCQSIKQQVSALTASENIKCIQLTEPLRELFFLCSFVLCKLCKLCNLFSLLYPVSCSSVTQLYLKFSNVTEHSISAFYLM